MPVTYDLAIIGGGINGAGIACDAAGRGLSVVLIEASGLAGATSSASSKLIHGGLRYLEQRDFGLVRKALAEREVLLAKAPHLIRPLRFVMPHVESLRPRWMIRLGLFLYDHLSRRRTIPGSAAVDLRAGDAEGPLKSAFRQGYTYWDCWVDDARLAILNARAAADRGAHIRTWTRFVEARAEDGCWQLVLNEALSGTADRVRAKAIVNAAGPWADSVAARSAPATARAEVRLRLVKGSHIVVPRIPKADDAYILQLPDGRVIFVLPFEDDFSLIGTTDISFEGDPKDAAASEAEIDYLLRAVNEFFALPLARDAVVWSYAGVRPLMDDGAQADSAVTRDYRLVRAEDAGQPPLLSVIGGKITTYRCLAEEALAALSPVFPAMGPPWTARAPLPGGAIPDSDMAAFCDSLAAAYGDIDAMILTGIARRHGTRATAVLGDARNAAGLGRHIGAGLYEREVEFMRDNEWARTAHDILWVHSKAALHLTPAERDAAMKMIGELL